MSENKSRILYVLRFLQEKSDEKHPVSTKQILDHLETQGFNTHRRKLPPITKWKAEIEKLNAERKRLDRDYYTFKDEVKECEQIRKSVDSILRQEQRERQPRRSQDIDR
jgi:hypothetical protein